MSDHEGRQPKEKTRHPEVPVDAIVQKRAMSRLGIKSPYRMDLLAKACIREGAPAVIIPEGNTYKHGKWYPAALLEAMRVKNAERPPAAPTDWRSTDNLSELLGLDYNTTREITWQVMADPKMSDHFGTFTSTNGSVTTFFDEVAAEAIRRRAAQRTDTARRDNVRERIRPSPLPPAAGPEDLMPQERANVASADATLMAALNGVETTIATYQALSRQIRNGTTRAAVERELATVAGYARQYRNDVLVHSKQDMAPRIVGLQNVLERLKQTLRQSGVLEDDED